MVGNLFAFSSDGTLMVLRDGREILVHRGSDDAPLWAHTLESEPVGLGAGPRGVVALESSGRLTWWNAQGESLHAAELGPASGFAVTQDGDRVAALLSGRVALVRREQPPESMEASGITAIAWSQGGEHLALGYESGELRIVTLTGETVATGKAKGAIASVCCATNDSWLATSGDGIFCLDVASATFERTVRLEGPVDCVAISPSGDLVGVRVRDDEVAILTNPRMEPAGMLLYPERKVEGVAFGPQDVVGVALVGGDANVFDARTPSLRRTDPFGHRQLNRWLVMADSKLTKGTSAPQDPPKREAPSPEASAGQARAVRNMSFGIVWLLIGLLGAVICVERTTFVDRALVILSCGVALFGLIRFFRAYSKYE